MESVRVRIEIRSGALTRRVRVTAPSIERAMKIAGGGMPDREVRLLAPRDPDPHARGEAA